MSGSRGKSGTNGNGREPAAPGEARRSLRTLCARDAARAVSAALIACAIAGVFEYALTAIVAVRGWLSAGEPVTVTTLLRLLCLDLALWAVFWVPLSAGLATLLVVSRLLVRLFAHDRAFTWPGLLARPANRETGATRLAAWMWALVICAVLYVPASAAMTVAVSSHFHNAGLSALLLGALQLGLIAAGAGLAYALFRLVRAAAVRLVPRLGPLNPLGRPWSALALLSVVVLIGVKIATVVRPPLAPLVPYRHLLAGTVLLFGLRLATAVRGERDALLPVSPRARLAALFVLIFGATVLVPVSLLRLGAEAHTKFVATGSSPPLASLIGLVRAANDFDRDGFGSLLGEGDCAAFDAAVYPAARDVPDNGIDENCDGHDFSLASLPKAPPGKHFPVPPQFDEPWNFLLITVDTVRYDHTTMGGYAKGKKRDTTPNLQELAERSVSFDFCNAPSAGTMASVPAILTSKFFHSGIALGPERKGQPPKVLPSNLLLGEVLSKAGYTTGAIVSHYYFNDWGMDQGFGTFDNSIGAKNEPYKVTSPEITDKALEWISRHYHEKWFLWVHYVDPHGRYVAHPDDVSYGSSEEDLYDGEIHYTDRYLGTLFDELAKIPGADHTVVIVTSDHGDGFNEHGFINHGMALYHELLHVPLIIYVPGARPRVAGGSVTNIDIVPTVVDLAGLDSRQYAFEGRSLVGPLLYGVDDPERIVFSETNWPEPLRSATSRFYKLIFHIKSNVYELYDLRKDPGEHRNLWHRGGAAARKMKAALDQWLERVYYARDFQANQVTHGQLAGVLLDHAPDPQHRASVFFDGGAIEVIGYDLPPVRAGSTVKPVVYVRVHDRPSGDFSQQLELIAPGAPGGAQRPVRSRAAVAAGGAFPTSRWRKGDFIRLELELRVPRIIASPAVLGLRFRGTQPDQAEARVTPGEPVARLGEVEVTGAEAPPPAKVRKPTKSHR